MEAPVFTSDSYKEILRSRLHGPLNRGRLALAAKALGCQRPYLSRVLLGDLHLTPDHAFNIAEFLNFTHDERDYFLALVEVERASSLKYRTHQLQRIADLKKKNESLLDKTKRPSLDIEALGLKYFTSWLWSALHFLTSIPEYQSVEALTARLQVKQSVILSHLEQLQSKGLVEHVGNKWCYKSGGDFHAMKESTVVNMHHQNWRQRALVDAQDFTNDSVHFTAVQAISRADAEKIKDLLLKYIQQTSEIAGPSKPEECVAIVCDFFRI